MWRTAREGVRKAWGSSRRELMARVVAAQDSGWAVDGQRSLDVPRMAGEEASAACTLVQEGQMQVRGVAQF